MFPLLPFAAGLLTGAVATRLIKAEKARTALDKAQGRVREATVSSLAAIEHTSAELRAKLMHAAEDARESERDSETREETGGPPQSEDTAQPEPEATAPPAEERPEEAPARRAARRRSAPRAGKTKENPDRAEKPDEEAM